MALSRASLVADKTSTGGTGTYTLDDPAAPGDGFRTLADAVASGHVTAGDTISYWVKDTTTQGAALAFEHGIGTVGAGGSTLARTTIIESSNGGAAVNWGGGGSRTVVIGLGASGLALLASAQTFTAAQTFSEAITVEKATATFSRAIALRNASAASTSNLVSAVLDLKDSGGTYRAALAIAADMPTITAAADTSRVRFFIRNAGAEAVACQIRNGILENGSSVAYALTTAVSGVLNAPTGQQLLSFSTPPTGWTRVNVTGERMVKLAGAADTLGATGGAWAISGLSTSVTVNAHTLTTAQIPAHAHAATAGSFLNEVAAGTGSDGLGAGDYVAITGATATEGGGGSHAHTASGFTSGDGAWRPAFEIGCVMQRN